MRRVTRITAPILLADIGDHCFGAFSLDLKSSDERIFGVHSHVFGVSIQLKSDGKLHSHVFLMRYFGSDVSKAGLFFELPYGSRFCCFIIAEFALRDGLAVAVLVAPEWVRPGGRAEPSACGRSGET